MTTDPTLGPVAAAVDAGPVWRWRALTAADLDAFTRRFTTVTDELLASLTPEHRAEELRWGTQFSRLRDV